MRKVSRDFIALRQPRCQYTLMVIKGVDRSKLYDGETDCYENVMREIRGNPHIFVCSGWLVGPYNEELDRTMILPWWWNVEVIDEGRSFRHYDRTPYSDNSIEFEYIVDRDIVEFIKDPLNQLKSSIPDPLEYSGETFYSVDLEKSEKTALGDLSLQSIFYSQRRTIISVPTSFDLDKVNAGAAAIVGISGGINVPRGNIILDI